MTSRLFFMLILFLADKDIGNQLGLAYTFLLRQTLFDILKFISLDHRS